MQGACIFSLITDAGSVCMSSLHLHLGSDDVLRVPSLTCWLL